MVCVFFFKQNTAYERRISDWSSDVCSSDLALCPLSPLHQPHNLAAIRAIAALAPDLPQIACFDTAFHHDKPEVAARLALPRALHEQGIRRFGFHGLSYEYIAGQLRARQSTSLNSRH